jgi:hypothetical protein
LFNKVVVLPVPGGPNTIVFISKVRPLLVSFVCTLHL